MKHSSKHKMHQQKKTHITRNIGAGVKLIRVALQCSCFPFWIFPNCIYIYMNMHLPNCSKHKPMPNSHESQLLNMIQACMWFSGVHSYNWACHLILYSYNYLICLTKCNIGHATLFRLFAIAPSTTPWAYIFWCLSIRSGAISLFALN